MSNSIEKQLNKIIATKMKLRNGLTLQQQLEIEVKRLYRCIQEYIDKYYDSYSPNDHTGYQRTFRFQGAMYAQDFLDARIVGNSIELSIIFHDDLAYHPSFSGESAFVPALINYGWDAPNLAAYLGKDIEHLTYYEGFHFIEKGIRDFNHTNKLGIHIDVDVLFDENSYHYYE